jgi:hypothetical protein
MAKLAGDPDSATSQWFVNLEDNLSLDTQNEGFTVFGKVLGNGMEVVDYLASVEVYNFGGPYAELPLWQLVQKPDGSLDVGPEDFLIVSSAEKLKSKKQPFVLRAESSDDSIVQVSVTNNQRIRLKTPKNASGTATISVEAVSTVDGTVDADRFDVVIGGSAQARSMERSAKKGSKFIDIFVDGGSFDDPFYRFFDSNGDELDRLKQRLRPEGSEVNRLFGDNSLLRELTGSLAEHQMHGLPSVGAAIGVVKASHLNRPAEHHGT